MKKFYFSFLMMVLSLCSASAQKEIESISEISNSKAYTIQSSRASLQVLTGDSCLYASTGTVEGLTELDQSNPNHQFALINGGKNYFLYSVGSGKFVDKNGNLTDNATEDAIINLKETQNAFYPINLNWGDSYYLNTQKSGSFTKGYVIDNWTTLDDGNQFLLVEVADFSDAAAIQKVKDYDAAILVSTVHYIYKCEGEEAFSYSKVLMGPSPLTVEYDAPREVIGATCSDSVPASKEITADTEETVVYNYTVDASALPFTPATITETGFAEGTKWYYLKPFSEKYYCYSTDEGNGIGYKNTNGANPIDLHYMFTFAGNPLSGFQIFNYVKGASMNVLGDGSTAYGTVEFSPSSTATCKYFLEAGNEDGQYRFNQTTGSDSYLHGYNSEIELYTWGSGWASTDDGSQFVIAEVAEKDIEWALEGVLSYEASPAYGSIFRNNEGLGTVEISFEGTSEDAAIVITEGMESEMITLVDEEGKAVAIPAYGINPIDPKILDITFSPEFYELGNYTLVIPEGLVRGDKSQRINTKIDLAYTFMADFEEKTVTARIWKSMEGYSSSDFPSWSTLPYEEHADGEYYTVKVKILGKDIIQLQDWMKAGGEKDTLKIQFDPSQNQGNVLDINDIHDADSYGSMWINTSTQLDPAGYSGCYMYPGIYSDASMDDEYGSCALCCYTYGDTYEYEYILADWYMDDRYALKEIVPGKVYKGAFTELGYTDDEYPVYTQLPYDEATGTYDIQVGIMDDAIKLIGYTKVTGENLVIGYDSETGDVNTFNGEELDENGSVWITSSVLDGVYSGWYAYGGAYSYVSYDSETQSGWAIISGYDYSVSDYRYMFVGIGNYNPVVTGIKAVNAPSYSDKMPAIYNIAGQKLMAPQKGVNIINGKKVIF